MSIVDVVSWVLLVSGSLFCIVGGIGLLRLPDFFSRLHAAGITDTLGAALVIFGMIVYNQGHLVQDYLDDGASLMPGSLNTVKLVMILALLWLTSPTATHAVSKAARLSGLQPQLAEEDSQ